MFFLFSGEGPTDFGSCFAQSDFCQGSDYQHGPMAMIIDQIVEAKHAYSLLEAGVYGFVPKRALIARAAELKSHKKAIKMPGLKRNRETLYFYNNARVLSRIAVEHQKRAGLDVVAVLFRDADGGHSSDRGLRLDKLNSMLNGFAAESFDRGIPMIPQPISEAWILHAVKYNYQSAKALEKRSGRPNSANPLKDELEIHSGKLSRADLVELFRHRKIDIERITMDSFIEFRQRLEDVIN